MRKMNFSIFQKVWQYIPLFSKLMCRYIALYTPPAPLKGGIGEALARRLFASKLRIIKTFDLEESFSSKGLANSPLEGGQGGVADAIFLHKFSFKSKIIVFSLLAISFALSSCSDPKSVPFDVQSVSVHPADWITESSPDFHGAALAARDFDTAECQQCHGNQFDGGVVEKSCFACHKVFPHRSGWVGSEASSHANYIKSNGYDFQLCKNCHGQDYSTVKIDNSCRTCHTNPDGPEACNTCHGAFAGDVEDLRNIAPPEGLDNEIDSASPAVGAHQAHLGHFISAEMICQECHTIPENMAAAGHIDADGEADVVFQGVLAITATEGGARQPAPAYTHASNSCENAYCHGNWGLLKSASNNQFIYAEDKIEGNRAAPVWIDPNTAACGTCHDLPPKGHNPFPLDACANCHFGVIDANGEIVDQSKHINGKANVFGQEYPMF